MKKSIKLIVSIALLTIIAACGGGSGSSSSTPTWETTSGSDGVTTLQVTDTQLGTGATAVAGKTLTVNYTGWLYQSNVANFEGPEFGSSNGTPISFQLGVGAVIPGWDQGLIGMQVGGTRTLIIPSAMAYGSAGNSAIPPGAALVFTVQLVNVQ
jgi:FKBP-type peptidyl-prolyl cis-trans isomerase FkpA